MASAPQLILDLNPRGPLVRRRRVDRLSPRQLAAFRQAFAAVQSDGAYRDFAQLYESFASTSLASLKFLPWNRAYLRSFEAALLDHVPGAALPWWDWTQQHEPPPAFSALYSRPEAGEPNPLSAIELPERDLIQRGPAETQAPALLTPARLRAVLAEDDFPDFSLRVEELHNVAHASAGHPLNEVPTAAYDPLFWPLQAMVDRIWRIWQQRHPGAQLPSDLLEEPLEPFGVRVADVLDPRALGYDYADLPRSRAKTAPTVDLPEVEDWRPVLPGYRSDEVPPVPVDQLGIEPEVEALCWVMVARETRPPLSIGLFGDWGSGKTTFMALMRARIEELGDEARRHPVGESPWCRNVRQITFNAWTYADDNLWASLATDIFTALSVPEQYEPTDDNDDRMPAVIARRRHRAEERLAEANDRIALAERRLQELPDSPAELAHDVLLGGDGEFAEEGFVKEIQSTVDQTVGPKAAGAVEDAATSVGVMARAVALGRALLSFVRSGGARRKRMIGLAGLALTVLIGMVVLAASGGLGWIVPALAGLASVAALIQPVLEAERALREGYQKVEQRVDDERASETEALAASAEVKAEATDELSRITSGRVVHEYFAERAASADYRERMGLLSTVRRDFTELRDWLNDDDVKRPKPDVDRIVLYVDDLDRCRAERVVEVLEAVHLLLAVDLFVVVVGVDPRWLLGSLEQHYEAQFATRAGSQNLRWQTTPQDFLEKIFQIPFSLRRMEAEGFRRLVGDLLPSEPGAGTGERGADGTPATATGAGETPEQPIEPQLASAEALALEAEESDPIGLRVSAAELSFLGDLAPLVPTPRAAKRLANTYRLLRAPLDRDELGRLMAGEYQAVLVLLAALVGFPGGASRIFSALLAEAPRGDWAKFVAGLDASPPDVMQPLVSLLREVTKSTKLSGSIETFQRWTPRVARYAFETARLAV